MTMNDNSYAALVSYTEYKLLGLTTIKIKFNS